MGEQFAKTPRQPKGCHPSNRGELANQPACNNYNNGGINGM